MTNVQKALTVIRSLKEDASPQLIQRIAQAFTYSKVGSNALANEEKATIFLTEITNFIKSKVEQSELQELVETERTRFTQNFTVELKRII